MSKYYTVIVLLLCASFAAHSTSVDSTTARTVALNFYTHTVKPTTTAPISLSLVHNTQAVNTNTPVGATNQPLYYVFNINAHDGFIIVAGDDAVSPILGYSTKGSYNGTNMPAGFQLWMNAYSQQIAEAITNALPPTADITTKWNTLRTGTAKQTMRSAPAHRSVAPLLITTWNQSPYYNALCPFDNNAGTNCVTGCVATTMAQVMKYWNYPAKGRGYHTYNSTYGNLSVNFGAATYNWAAMSLNVLAPDTAVAQLMYDCGVSVDMSYSPTESGAWVIASDNPVCAQNSYVQYFNYDSTTIQGLSRFNYTDADWTALVENELNNSRVIEYAGWGSLGGHTWVCDGYDVNDFFHMNWGWAGSDDGYFDPTALNPGGQSGYDFSTNQEAVIGIQPVVQPDSSTSAMQLYAPVTITPATIYYGQPFTVQTNVYNAGSSNFNGTFYAILHDHYGRQVAVIDSFTTGTNSLAVAQHFTNGLTFSGAHVLLDSGTYTIGIYCKAYGGNMALVSQYLTYINPVPLNITSAAGNLELYTAITPSPGILVKGYAASINVDIFNNNPATYYGMYKAVLTDTLGNIIDSISTYNETQGLTAYNDYNAPYITFTTDSITAAPGTYNLVILTYSTSTKEWSYAGNDYYANPLRVQVIKTDYKPDIYEVDNTVETAYAFTPQWHNDSALVTTAGSNIHIPNDVDYYKILLAPGYKYNVTAKVNDYNSSADGNTYTNVMQMAYKSGNMWSSSYISFASASFMVYGQDSVFFFLAPYSGSSLGTYVLDVNITRQASTGINSVVTNNVIELFPNPASNTINIKTGNASFTQLHVLNALGQVVINQSNRQGASVQSIDVSALANGLYYIEAVNDKQRYIAKFVISK